MTFSVLAPAQIQNFKILISIIRPVEDFFFTKNKRAKIIIKLFIIIFAFFSVIIFKNNFSE